MIPVLCLPAFDLGKEDVDSDDAVPAPDFQLISIPDARDLGIMPIPSLRDAKQQAPTPFRLFRLLRLFRPCNRLHTGGKRCPHWKSPIKH